MKKTGVVESFNVSPKGTYEGLLLRSAKGVCQVNFGRDAFYSFNVGDEMVIEVEAEETRGNPAHEVFALTRVVAYNGQKPVAHDGQFAGSVAGLNYALHGEVNGAILDSGDFLHLKPGGARAVGLEMGMQVTGHGVRKPMVGNHQVIEAEEVNGVRMEDKHAAKKQAAKKHAAKKYAK